MNKQGWFKFMGNAVSALVKIHLDKFSSRRWVLIQQLLLILIFLNVVLFALIKLLPKDILTGIVTSYITFVIAPFMGIIGVATGYWFHLHAVPGTSPDASAPEVKTEITVKGVNPNGN